MPLKVVKTFKRKEVGPDRSASNSQFLSVTLNELAMKASESIVVISSFNKAVSQNTDINPKEVRIAMSVLGLYVP